MEILEDAGIDRAHATAITKAMETISPDGLATEVGIAKLRTEMHEIKADLIKFMYMQAAAIIGLTVTLVKLI